MYVQVNKAYEYYVPNSPTDQVGNTPLYAPAMPINPRSYVPAYQQLASILREQIMSGDLAPGEPIPGEVALAQQHEIGRETVRKALQVLRAEGLIYTRRADRSYVREIHNRRPVHFAADDKGLVRMPTPEERDQLDLDEGIPIVVITRGSGDTEMHPADRVTLHGPES
jgi:DNA-binding transcriptional regulator YhcF (GntR family)